jgi:SOS regulatory protein LexA
MHQEDSIERAREVVWRFFRREGRLPSYSEMSVLFAYSSKSAAFKLAKKLIQAGILEKGAQGKLIPKKLSVPLRLLGAVKAGFPSHAEEELLDTLSLDDYLVKNPQASFLLKVSGDSMIEEGILPGDLVVIERGPKPKNGQVVLAQMDGEWTLKFYEKKGEKVRLIAGNKKYPALIPRQELYIAGVLRAVVRRYE